MCTCWPIPGRWGARSGGRAWTWCPPEDNPNAAWAKSRRQRVVPLDFLTVQAFDTYQFERITVPAAAGSDFVLVNLFRAPVGAPMRPDAVNDLVAAA